MIEQFDSSLAGRIDLENAGHLGTPVASRRHGKDRPIEAHRKAEARAQAMDRLVYGAFWMAEHHFQPDGTECLPNIVLLAAHLAHLSERLEFRTGFDSAPMRHPPRLAEDFAGADSLTNGRVVFVVGRGFRTREVETSGSPPIDQAANRELFEEQVEIIFEALDNDSFSHRGKYDTLPPAAPYRGDTLKEPTLAARLPVECWQPIQSGTALAGCHGETWDLGRDRRRLGPGRCDGQGHARMAGGARADRIEPRTGRADGHPVPVPYREIQGRRNERSG